MGCGGNAQVRPRVSPLKSRHAPPRRSTKYKVRGWVAIVKPTHGPHLQFWGDFAWRNFNYHTLFYNKNPLTYLYGGDASLSVRYEPLYLLKPYFYGQCVLKAHPIHRHYRRKCVPSPRCWLPFAEYSRAGLRGLASVARALKF